MAPDLGTDLADYQVLAYLGGRRLGTANNPLEMAVYRARHARQGHEVAIKILFSRGWLSRGAQMFEEYARFSHPHLLPILRGGVEPGRVYTVMPYMRGGNLGQRLGHGPLAPSAMLAYLRQVAAALDYAYADRGWIYGRLTPANVLLDEWGNAQLADFVVSRLLTGYFGVLDTHSALAYCAPEQAREQTDWRSDIYALGVILYQALTNQVPFTGDSASEILIKHCFDSVPLSPLRAISPSLPATVEDVVLRALAKDPATRYQTGQELVTALETAIDMGAK